MNEKETRICRLCLRILFKENFFDINYVEPISGFMPFRDQITTCMPELVNSFNLRTSQRLYVYFQALDILPDCYICLNCADSLKSAYEFKNNCLMIEEKIKQYFDQLSPENECELLDLSKFARNQSDEEIVEENENDTSTDLDVECRKMSL